ncbi:MAG: GAF domain-containing protein [Alphaproteobacteria bacterium]|nr:MAG: GAF domain-containing protein [Alphaproteobacteria bacterium]
MRTCVPAPHGTLSFISVPIMVGRKWWGFLGFDDCKEERSWSSEEIHVLKTAAALIAGAIEREQASRESPTICAPP